MPTWPGWNEEKREERCCNCDDLTGRCGIADDSLHCECGGGPYCGECFDEHIAGCTEYVE